MKCNKFSAALVALGLVSAASVATASSTAPTVTFNSTNYTEVFVTGSTAFGAGTVKTILQSLFKNNGFAYTTGAPSTSSYFVYGVLNGGGNYLINVDLTGSEAGLYALEGQSAGVANGSNILPGTPTPSQYYNFTTPGWTASATPDLAFSDTGYAVSLSKSLGLSADTDFGIVGVIPFGWFKGTDTIAPASDSSWSDLTNVTQPQMKTVLNAAVGSILASYLTGVAADQDDVYLIGRNQGSGTRVNTLLDLNAPVGKAITQFAANNATYVNGVLTYNAPTQLTFSSAGGIKSVGNDGFDAGSGVVNTLVLDSKGATDSLGLPFITVGYVGISSLTATNTTTLSTTGNTTLLTLDGVTENDGTVINGTYSFWGHEHLYAAPSPSSVGAQFATLLTGNTAATANETLGNANTGGSNTAGGAIEAYFESNIYEFGEASDNLNATRSPIIDPAAMAADKPSDAGYPAQFE